MITLSSNAEKAVLVMQFTAVSCNEGSVTKSAACTLSLKTLEYSINHCNIAAVTSATKRSQQEDGVCSFWAEHWTARRVPSTCYAAKAGSGIIFW